MKINYDELNENHCRWVDKFYRQFAGLSSEIISFKNKTIELEVRISRRWPKDPETTAIQISNDWRRTHECLRKAKVYRVRLIFLNPDQDTGGTISPDLDRPSMIQEINSILEKMSKTGECKSILLTGSFDDVNRN